MLSEMQERREGSRDHVHECFAGCCWSHQHALVKGRTAGSPLTPSRGRWTTSRVALSGSSSRMRTSIGPDTDASAAVLPVESVLSMGRAPPDRLDEIDQARQFTYRTRTWLIRPLGPASQAQLLAV